MRNNQTVAAIPQQRNNTAFPHFLHHAWNNFHAGNTVRRQSRAGLRNTQPSRVSHSLAMSAGRMLCN